MFFLQPSLSLTNSCNAPTLGVDISAIMLMMTHPVRKYIHQYMERQIAKNLSVGLAVNSVVYPLSGAKPIFIGNIPISINWSNFGYYNKELD